jgi:hypothetical protein
MQYVLVTGSREGVSPIDVDIVLSVVCAEGEWTVVQGGAQGADRMAKQWAQANGRGFRTYGAQWKQHSRVHVPCRCGPEASYCKAAGVRRNELMLHAHHYDRVVAFPRGEARGTNDMIQRARDAGYQVTIDYGDMRG